MFTKAVALLSQTFRVDVRQVRTHFLRGAVAAGVLWIMAMNHTDMRSWSAPGLDFCAGLAIATMVMMTLMGAFYFPSVITEEKEEQTLGLLRMAGVGSATLLLGKSVGRVGIILLLIAVTLPYWWLGITLGGVTFGQVATVAVGLAAHLALMSQIGTLCSVYFSTTGRACIASAIILALLLLGPVIAEELLNTAGIVQRGNSIFTPMYEHMAPVQLVKILRPGYAGGMFTTQVWSNVGAALVLFGLSWLLLDRFNTYDQVAGPTPQIVSRLKALIPQALKGRRRTRRSPSGSIGQAVSWKDFRQFGGGYKWWGIRCVGFAGAVLLASFDRWRSPTQMVGVALIITAFWAGIAEIVFHAGHLFHRELKEQTWDSLRMLPLSTGALCRRKIFGVLPALVPTFAALFLGMAFENMDTGRSLVDEISSEFDRYPITCSMVTAYCISGTLMAVFITSYFGLKVNPWLGTVLSTALFGFVVISTFWCCFGFMNLDGNDTAGLVFFCGACLNIVVATAFFYPIRQILIGETNG